MVKSNIPEGSFQGSGVVRFPEMALVFFTLTSFKANYTNNLEKVEILNLGVFIWNQNFLLHALVDGP